MSLDKRLEQRFKSLEDKNRSLRQEVNTLRNTQTQSGSPVRRGLNSILKLTTLGKIANKRLYIPSSKISPVGPRFRRRRIL